MKILLDECTPRVLKKYLTDFEVTTVQEVGWAGITNGALLQLAENQFDVPCHERSESQVPTELNWQTTGDLTITHQSRSCCNQDCATGEHRISEY